MTQGKYIGIDVQQATISVAVLNSSGKLMIASSLNSGDFATSRAHSRTQAK